jgi:hypothetical protein
VKYEWEANAPKCCEICGVLFTNINQFIEECVKDRD